jgi:sugar phosphate isomerase/epimerase
MPSHTFTRRQFLTVAASTGLLPAQTRGEQAFLAGVAPSNPAGARGGPPRPAPIGAGAEDIFWKVCDDCSALGWHYLEFNTTNRRVVDTFESRISEFRDQMSRRHLTVLGLAVYSHMHDPSRRAELIEQHLRVARFLKAVGGRYITQLIAPGPNLGDGEDEEYRRVDVKAMAANANEVGKRVREETGVRIGYHPEQGDIRAGIFEPILQATDPRYVDYMPDVGHIGACGLDPLPIYKKYRSRMIGTHLKDYSPTAEYERNGQRMKGRMVPFGEGVVKLPSIIQFLKDTKFTGHAMGEGSGTNQQMRDYLVQKLGLRI